jgi:hypothetical protein
MRSAKKFINIVADENLDKNGREFLYKDFKFKRDVLII